MPPKKATPTAMASSTDLTFNDGDMKFIQSIFEAFSAEAKEHIDWDALQAKQDLQSIKATKKKFRLFCQKHKWCEYAEGSASGGSKKRAAEDEDGSKSGKGKAKKQKNAEEAEEDADED
ncbi:uncharacterized protein B0I36DRAFT_344284 [Microdochium trichocladiopsis]|uniref:Uncharacterized protein n=1 Tax=Microdochium trichocladiopsis TaxID=1682393 RepID=A0A9P9BW89_9PEZI|nr:uncharacterized protein B0I36DRAFT_344284 [Microdochium trichocladiopsis]KAH7040557.1 hypothetical protein B0I36DRAFT_344284 [Microdochium trichocladiopsis]